MAGKPAVRVRACAKINLLLHVGGRRADGFHDLRTLFQSIALHDTLTVRTVRGPFRLTCTDAACPADRSNLVWRAVERVWRAAGRTGEPRDIAIRLTKRIPMQAGLGGGSSDAAAALRVLGARWRVPEVRLRRIAASLGSDVPYFFAGGPALGTGRGTRLVPLRDLPPFWVTLVIPDFGVSTADAYTWLDQDRPHPAPATRKFSNDLEAPVARRHPEIRRLVRALKDAGAAHAAMSGSGSAVFGLFHRRTDAERAARSLAAPKRQAFLTRTLGRHGGRLAGIVAHRIDLPFAPRGLGRS